MIAKTIELKFYGYLTIFFGIIDLLNMALDVSEINGLMAASSQADTIFTYVTFGLSLLIMLAKLWMGRQALCYAKGVGKGTSHILLAKIGIGFGVLMLLNDVVELFIGIGDITEVASSVVYMVIIISYYQAAKACL
jgi:hypothetical protein